MATAREGMQLLKKGCSVTKHGRHGKPHKTVLTLSDDGAELMWESHGLLKSKKHQSILLANVLELAVGHESSVFKRVKSKGHSAHLCLSLLLPLFDEGDEGGGGRDRESLDLSFDEGEEETFGLW